VLGEQEQGPFLGWLTMRELAQALGLQGRAGVESVRRATRTLAAEGSVQADTVAEDVPIRAARVDRGDFLAYRDRHRAGRHKFAARLPVSVDTEKAEAESLAKLLALEARITAAEARHG
jgi:hypothetical protein